MAAKTSWNEITPLSAYVHETKVCRYKWHSAGSLGWPFPMLEYEYIFSNKIHGSNFIKRAGIVMV